MPQAGSRGGGALPGGGRQVLRGPGHGGGLAGLHSNPHQLTEDCRLRHSSRIRGLPHRRLPTMAVSALSARSNLFCRFKAILAASSCLSSSSWSNHTSDRVESSLGYGKRRTLLWDNSWLAVKPSRGAVPTGSLPHQTRPLLLVPLQ